MEQVTSRTKNFATRPDSTNDSIEGAVQEISHQPSHSDSKPLNPLDPNSHVTLPPQLEVLIDDENGDSKKVRDTNEDRDASEHWETVSDLAADVTRAARNALFKRRRTFKKVVAVIAYWKTSTGLEHLRDQADRLGRLFKDRFKFEVLICKISEYVSNIKFIATITHELEKVADDPDSLFILYYGGYASMVNYPRRRLQLWKKDDDAWSPPHINWSNVKVTLFEGHVVCNKLFILDCCHAGGMIDATIDWKTSCELLGACAADVEASAVQISSFTTALLKELSENAYDTWELHIALCSFEKPRKYKLANPPRYQNFMGRRSGNSSALLKEVGSTEETEDRRWSPSSILARLTAISDAVTFVIIRFGCTADALMEEIKNLKGDWKRRSEFPLTECDDIIVKACEGPKLLAAFDSDSCITMWHVPVWLWDAMAPLKDHQQMGIVAPQNFALATSGSLFDPAATECSSSSLSRSLSSS